MIDMQYMVNPQVPAGSRRLRKLTPSGHRSVRLSIPKVKRDRPDANWSSEVDVRRCKEEPDQLLVPEAYSRRTGDLEELYLRY